MEGRQTCFLSPSLPHCLSFLDLWPTSSAVLLCELLIRRSGAYIDRQLLSARIYDNFLCAFHFCRRSGLGSHVLPTDKGAQFSVVVVFLLRGWIVGPLHFLFEHELAIVKG